MPARPAISVLRIVVLCGALLPGSWANAGSIDDCNQVRNPDLQVRGCTAYIKRSVGSPQSLATAHINRANVYARRGSFDRAIADYATAIGLDPTNPLAPYNRGNVYFDIKLYERAMVDFTRAIALDRRFALAYYNRGLAQERLGDTEAAANDYRQVLVLDPTLKRAQLRLERLQSW
jgi:tetratricopeptide (TPR) repeat protein